MFNTLVLILVCVLVLLSVLWIVLEVRYRKRKKRIRVPMPIMAHTKLSDKEVLKNINKSIEKVSENTLEL